MLEHFNPSNWNVSPAEYQSWWAFLKDKGVWSIIIAVVSLVMCVYSINRRKFCLLVELVLFVIAVFITYFASFTPWFD